MKAKYLNAQEKSKKLFQEERRLISLGAEAYSKYDYESLDFITQFIPQFLEYYENSQKRDKQANFQPLKWLISNPIRNILTKFDLNLLFPERIWEFSITTNFLEELNQIDPCPTRFSQILYLMKSILQGDFEMSNGNTSRLSDYHLYQFKKIDYYTKTFPHSNFYEIYNQFNQQESVVIQIIPKQKFTLNNQNQLETLLYVDNIIFISLENNSFYNSISKYLQQKEKEPFLRDELNLIQEIKQPLKHGQVKIGEEAVNQFYTYVIPRSFKVTNFQKDQFYFNQTYQKWMRKQYETNYKKRKQQINDLKSSFFLVKKYLFTPNFQQYKNLLKNIKSEKFTVNLEQFQAISQQNDTILIGRSGTGKTTISLLKLFISDAIFILRQNLDLYKESNIEINMQYNQQQQNGIQLKTLFLTSSPLLAQQIKQKYQNLVKNVEENLIKKSRAKRLAEQQKENLEDSTVQILDMLGEEEENENQIEYEDENEEDIDQYEKEMGQFSTIQDIKTFPAFLTIRKLLFLIDKQLQNPFFKHKDLIHRSAQWHNECFGILSLNHYGNNNISDKLNSEANDLDSREIIYRDNTIKEVTQQCFKEFFWPKIKEEFNWKEKQILQKTDPMLVWSDIINIIKGHETSYQFPNFHLSQEEYNRITQSENVFKIYLIYEQLKSKYGYYDILDLINHINHQQVYCLDTIEYMHYIILDELQDVPKALLILLNRMTQVQLFLAGDNAQNIVKGIGIKFQDIVKCLEKEKEQKQSLKQNEAQLLQLSFNFRSSNQILQLGNTIVNILEIFYPNYIDVLQKERSNQQGPKPTIIKSIQIQDLLNYLSKQYKNKQSNVEFGYNQVIIVKDQDSKLKIPLELQNAIILTIYEAKGLEFDDVILFNFFADSNNDEDIWSLFQQLEIIKIPISNHDWKNRSKQNAFLMYKQSNKNTVEGTLLQLRKFHSKKLGLGFEKIDPNKINLSLQHELKQLYVAITRPRSKLIIFDQSLQNRFHIQKLWEELEIVDIINENQLSQIQENKFVLQFTIDNRANWKKQGYRMLRQNTYEQAYKCFMLASEINLAKKSMAYNLATQATLNSNNFQLFLQAAQIFEEINLIKRAASCYFSGKNYQKALELYQQLNSKNEMAESAYFLGEYQLAGHIFSEIGEIRRSIECFNKQKLWNCSLDQLNLKKDEFTSEEKLMFLNLIIPNYLKNLIEDIEQEELLEKQIENTINLNDETESFQVENTIINQSQIEQQIDNDENDRKIISIKDNDDSQSFQVIQDDSFDHLSFYDPEDEWIKPENKSLIKSIASSSIESQFSNILLMNYPSDVPILKSKLNVFIKNKIMLQLAERFQQFQNEFKILLENQKSQSALLSFRNQDEKEQDHMVNFMYDLDQLDIESVYFVLDILEHFKCYKLCIYVCNQFKLSSHLGRYLISLASQYTPMSKNNFKLENWIIGNNLKRKRLLDQSIVAQLAFTNILESINPIYLQFKNEEQLNSYNSFGIECYKQLIGLGYWRTIIYQLNYENAIKLCQSFNNYQDMIILIQKIKEQREKNQLTDEEQYQLIKYNYFIQVEQYFLSNQSKNINIDQLFQITISCASQRKLTKENISQLIQNLRLDSINLSINEKLKQLESIILCMFCCMGILKFELNQYSFIIELVEILQYCINQLQFCHHNKTIIIEALQFIFRFSFPIGDIMIDFSQYCIIHITSQLMKNISDQMIFMDIAYEYILIPFEILGKLIKSYISYSKPISTLFQNLESQKDQQVMQIIFKCLKQRLQYQCDNILSSFISTSKDQNDYYSKTTYGIKQKTAVNALEDHETSILHFIKSDEMRVFHKWLLQTNFRYNQMDKKIRFYLKNESIFLFEQGFKNQQQKHGFIILALNLLHLQGNIPLAIFILQNMKNKDQIKYYLKYLEFLECQHFEIIEDSYECFIQFLQHFENKMYLDEWMNHLTRIGIKLLLAQKEIKQIIIPQKYQEIISYQEKIDYPLFQITKVDIIEDFIEQLLYYLQICNSGHYEYQCNLLLIVFIINLQNLSNKIKNRLCSTFSNYTTYPYYKSLHQFLNKKNPNLQQDLINKMDILYIKGYFEEKLITLQISANSSNLKPQVVYKNCLNKWEGYFLEAQIIKKNGKNLLKKWRQFKFLHKRMRIQRSKSVPQVIRFYQFNKLQSKDIQFKHKDIQHESFIVKIFNFQEELIKLRQKMLRGADLQFVNSILNSSTSILQEIKNGILQVDLLEDIKMKFQSWKNSVNVFEKNEQELLERNRQILKMKWQKLQAGVKVQNKFDQIIQTVNEHQDEESQD